MSAQSDIDQTLSKASPPVIQARRHSGQAAKRRRSGIHHKALSVLYDGFGVCASLARNDAAEMIAPRAIAIKRFNLGQALRTVRDLLPLSVLCLAATSGYAVVLLKGF